MKTRFLPLALLVVSKAVLATSNPGPYDGLDINFNETEPPLYSYCREVVKIDPAISGETKLEAMEACGMGVDAARRMADRFGGGNGNIQGYLRGYAWGMHEMYEASENDGSAYKQGEAAVSGMGNYIESGLTEGIKKGNSEGNADGRSEAITRFDKAVSAAVPGTSGIIPSNVATPPARVYTPEPNAYARLIPADQKAYTTIDDILKARDEREMNQLQLRDFPVYSQYDATTWGETKRLTIWDLWFGDGRYVFSKALWYDEKAALATWLTRPAPEKPQYQGLAQKVVNNNAGVRYDLQIGFQKAFTESYRYYVNYYFAKEFKKGVNLGQLHGEAVGTQLGKRVAFGRGLIAAFNKKFEDSATQTYQNAYKGSFMNSFNGAFDEYSKNPKLDMIPMEGGSTLVLTGTDDDGVLQPGEAFSLKFKMKNMGGVGTDLKGILAGDILDAKPVSGNINKLMIKEYDTVEAVGLVDGRLQSGDQANISLTVNGISKALNIVVTKLVRMTASPSFETDTLNGRATVSILAKNVSTIETPAHISAQATIDGKIVGEMNVGKLAAGQATRLDLKIANIDPMDLIAKDTPVKVTLIMGGIVLETQNIVLKAKNSNKDLVNYVAGLANGKGMIPSTTSIQDRLTDASKLLVARNRAELTNNKKTGNIWKKAPDTTIPGMLRLNKHLGSPSEEAKKLFDQLAKEMWKDKKVLPAFLFFHAKRNAYKNILEDITISGKLKE
ncbi:MAG: hypothetical protein ACOYL6_14955 [Bacteriovoracaceae bacterium]